MRVCLIDESKGKRVEKPRHILTFREVGVYVLPLPVKRGKTAKLRVIRREIKKCRKLGVSIFGIPHGSPYAEAFRTLGESPADERRFFSSRIPDLALTFAKSVGAPQNFFIGGGSARAVSEIACELLAKCRFVFSDTEEFERASELVLQKTGAPLRRGDVKDCVRIELFEGDVEFLWEEKRARLSDFYVEMEKDISGPVPENLKLVLLSVLELVGKIGRNETKTACLIK